MSPGMMMMTEQTYADAYRQGFRSTLRLMISKGLHAEQAEEYAQRAWVRGWESRAQIKDVKRIVQWVNSIAINGLYNDWRRERRLCSLGDAARYTARPETVEEKIDSEKLLARCSPLDQALMVERFAEGHDLDELAGRHQMREITARVRIHRACHALRRYVASKGTLPAVPVAA